MNNKIPLSRFEDIVVQELKDEILVCDTKYNQVFCLNQTAGEVWKLCDGKKNYREIAKELSKKMKVDFTEELVLFTLGELSKQNLLVNQINTNDLFGEFSRREVIKKIGLTSMVAIPLISSVVMPQAMHAASSCNNDTDCGAGECCDTTTNTCNTTGSFGCVCSGGGDCLNFCCTTNIGVCNDPPTATCGGGVDCPAPYICCVNPTTGPAGSNCSCDGFC